MRAFLKRRFLKSSALAGASILVLVGICYAAVQNFGGNKLVNVGGITIGSAATKPANQIEFEQSSSVVGFHSGEDAIYMRNGNDLICLGWADDELTFNSGNGQITFGGDWYSGTPDTAGIQFTDSSDELVVWSSEQAILHAEGLAMVTSNNFVTCSGYHAEVTAVQQVTISSGEDVVVLLGVGGAGGGE